jgi:hypothetical protein
MDAAASLIKRPVHRLLHSSVWSLGWYVLFLLFNNPYPITHKVRLGARYICLRGSLELGSETGSQSVVCCHAQLVVVTNRVIYLMNCFEKKRLHW